MKTISALICFLLVSALGTASADEINLKLLADSELAFGIDMYHKLASPDKNVFFSPYSIYAALGMVYAGAQDETADQIKQVLHTSAGLDIHQGIEEMDRRLKKLQEEGSVELAVANSIWPDRGHKFLETYLARLKNNYGVLIEAVDYKMDASREEARNKINVWVESKTRDKIKN